MRLSLRDMLADISERLMCDGIPPEFAIEPAQPTDEELLAAYWEAWREAPVRENRAAHAYALRAVLSKWGPV